MGKIGPPTLQGSGSTDSKQASTLFSQSFGARQSSSMKATYLPLAFLYPLFLAYPNPCASSDTRRIGGNEYWASKLLITSPVLSVEALSTTTTSKSVFSRDCSTTLWRAPFNSSALLNVQM